LAKVCCWFKIELNGIDVVTIRCVVVIGDGLVIEWWCCGVDGADGFCIASKSLLFIVVVSIEPTIMVLCWGVSFNGAPLWISFFILNNKINKILILNKFVMNAQKMLTSRNPWISARLMLIAALDIISLIFILLTYRLMSLTIKICLNKITKAIFHFIIHMS